MKYASRLLAAAALAVCAAAAFSQPALGQSQLEGQVSIDGSSTVFPISEAVANEFRKKYPKVKVTVGESGTGGGFKRFVKGEIDISDASRPITADEYAQCKQGGILFFELPIAYDGLSIVVNKQNDWVKQLTVADLQKIFLKTSAAKTWKQVNPAWPDAQIEIYAPGTDSGTFDYFKEIVGGKEKQEIRADMSVSEHDEVLVTGVAGEKNAIGFFGCAYYFENKDKLRVVPVVNASGKPTAPTPETIESGEYNPFGRPLFIYVNARSLRRPEVKSLVDFYVANAPQSAAQVGYVALPDEIYKLAGDNLKTRQMGTHFLKGGKKLEGSLVQVYKPENLDKQKP